jgi:hypothetical protein
MANFSEFFPAVDAPVISVHDRAGVIIALVTDYAEFYAPLVHGHVIADITDFPLTMPPSVHTHVEADISNLDKYTVLEVDNALLLKEDSVTYTVPGHVAVANSTLDGFEFVPLPDSSFYKLRGTCVPYTGATVNGFADVVGDIVITELVADVAPTGVGSANGVTYRCDVDLGLVVIVLGQAAVEVTKGDLLTWSGSGLIWIHQIDEPSIAVSSVNTKVGAVTISAIADGGIVIGDGGGSDITVTTDPQVVSVVGHKHVEADITDLDKYTQADVDALIAAIPTGIQYQLLATSSTLAVNIGYLCDPTVAALSLLLPALAPDNSKIEVIDTVGLAGTNNITLLPDGTDTIMGGVDFVLNTNYSGVELVKMGTDWMFIGSLGESVIKPVVV